MLVFLWFLCEKHFKSLVQVLQVQRASYATLPETKDAHFWPSMTGHSKCWFIAMYGFRNGLWHGHEIGKQFFIKTQISLKTRNERTGNFQSNFQFSNFQLEMDYDTDTKSENNFLLKHKSLSRLETNVPAISNRSKRLWISWFSVGRFFFFDTRCPFGLRSPVLICQRTTRAVIHVFTNGGYTADAYLNNFYGTEHLSTASAAFERLQELFDELG